MKKENNKRAEELKNIEAKGVPSSTIHSFSKAMDAGINVEKLMNTAVIAKKKGVDFEAVLARSVETNSCDCNNSDSFTSDMSVYNSDDQQYDTSDIPNVITSNIAPLIEIAQTVGSDNLPYVAEHVDDIMNFMLDEKPTNMSRRIINYIGKKIYEQYLVNEGIKYKAVDDGLSGCDYNINDGEKYVSVVSTRKSIADNKIPVGISAAQNAFLRNHPNAQIRIVRISLTDISILPQFDRIIGIYGNEDEPIFNDRLRKECDELAANYWKGADIGEFDAVSPEYSIKVERKNKHK